MDSRLLYSATTHLISIINWDKDWIHFGTEKETNIDLITNTIDGFLVDENLHLVLKRDNSGTFSKDEIMTQIRGLLGQVDFQLWNISMDKVIRFHKIGVLQCGKK